jgi:WXG100 family type VII secretion target
MDKSQWSGAARDAFYRAWAEWQPAGDGLRRELYSIGDGLDNSHKNYSQMELDNALGIARSVATY